MKICDQYDHLGAIQLLQNKNGLYQDVKSAISKCQLVFGDNRPQEIKDCISKELNKNGWADRVKIQMNTNLTISFMKDRVGLCIQLGNVARTYADLLKLTYLGKKGIIDLGLILVPDARESVLLGANYARFDRLSREIEIFFDIINVPILVLALTN